MKLYSRTTDYLTVGVFFIGLLLQGIGLAHDSYPLDFWLVFTGFSLVLLTAFYFWWGILHHKYRRR